jgi:hypothetical protein
MHMEMHVPHRSSCEVSVPYNYTYMYNEICLTTLFKLKVKKIVITYHSKTLQAKRQTKNNFLLWLSVVARHTES